MLMLAWKIWGGPDMFRNVAVTLIAIIAPVGPANMHGLALTNSYSNSMPIPVQEPIRNVAPVADVKFIAGSAMRAAMVCF
jgi:hypothetical protein